jgi:hypothetical protein
MNVITGIGWVTEREYGCVRRRLRRPYADLKSLRSKLQGESVLSYPVKGFGKYDRASQVTCCVAALALYDAEMSYSESQKQDIGILGTNADGCLQSNLDFFNDFVENGRILGRANLFVYTLPSIPVAEAAIHFKCQGPLLYVTFPGTPIASLLRQADRMIRQGESTAMLAVMAGEEDGQCFVLRRASDTPGESLSTVEELVEIEKRTPPLDEMIAAVAKP